MATNRRMRIEMILAATDRTSRVINVVFSKLDRKLDRVKRRSAAIARQSEQIGRTTAIAGAATVAALAAPTKVGMDFEQQMANVGAVAGANAEQLKEMSATARQLGKDTQFSASQAAQAMEFLAMAGFGVEKSQKALPTVLSLAAAGSLDLGRSADIVSNILSGFGLEMSKLSTTADVLTNVFTSSNTNLEMIGQTMKFVGPIAKLLGEEVHTVAAMTGLLGDSQIQGEQAGTSLRQMFLRLSSPVRMAKEALGEIGVTTQTATGDLKPVPELLSEIGKKLQALPTAARASVIKRVFGTEASAAAAILTTKAASGELTTYIEKVQKSGTAATIAAQKLNTQRGSYLLLRSAVEELALTVSDKLGPVLIKSFDKIREVVKVVGDWAEKNPKLTQTIVLGTAAAGVALTVLGGLGFVIGGVARGVAVATTVFRGLLPILGHGIKLFRVLAVVMAANPIGAVIAAVVGLTAVFVGLWRNSEGFRGALTGVWEVLKGVGDIIKTYVVGQAQGLWQVLQGIATFNPAKVSQGIATAATAAHESIKMGANLDVQGRFNRGYESGAQAVRNLKQGGNQERSLKRTSTGGDNIKVEFAPVFNGGGPAGMDEQGVLNVFRQYEPELIRTMEEAQRKKNRLSY